jgi:hypothetical protein
MKNKMKDQRERMHPLQSLLDPTPGTCLSSSQLHEKGIKLYFSLEIKNLHKQYALKDELK